MDTITGFPGTVHPSDTLSQDEGARVARTFRRRTFAQGQQSYAAGSVLDGLFLIQEGEVEVVDSLGELVSILGPRNSFGERGLMREGLALTTARAARDTVTLVLPVDVFRRLFDDAPGFRRFFQRGRLAETRPAEITTQKVGDLMSRAPVTVAHDTSVREAAQLMRDRHVSCLGVTEEGRFSGLLTTRDLAGRVLAEGLSSDVPVGQVMTRDPVSLSPAALGSNVLHLMLERRIGHLPVTEDGALVGIVTQTDLTRYQAVSSAQFVHEAALAETVDALAAVTARIPRLVAQLVGAHHAHEVVTRLATDIADTVTRRLIALAEKELGPAPVPYLWLACGSQGRQEQSSVTDQDNCMILDDRATPGDMVYFAALARRVSDGLDACGYVHCPGDMMATNPRWCQTVSVWRSYFAGWVNQPDPMAQMLASVMFDLRPIAGAASLYETLQAETLSMAAQNTIFVAHMVSNSLKHAPPLGLLRGIATIRSGEHRNHIDLKHNGVVPVTDLGRVYALMGRVPAVNTRARLEAAESAGILSHAGGRDLIDAYDLIARTRLEHQSRQIRRGQKPDNFLSLSELSDFERSHLRDAFVVFRTMQSSVGQSRGAPIWVGLMGIELIAGFVAAIACAGMAMLLRKLSRGRLPKWITPAAAGAGMIAFAIWSEYDWFSRLSGELPEGVVIVWQDQTPNPLRPWTYVVPLTTAFTAMDGRRLAPHPDNGALVLAPVYAFARWQGVKEGYMVVDCAARQSAILTETVRIDADGKLVGASWTPLGPEDAAGRAACPAE